MKTFQIEFYFDQGNTIVQNVKGADREAALNKIPSNGTYEMIDELTGKLYRITINLVKYIVVTEI
ncbi:hypothetical protein [Planococcus sp. 107-1]|uniref:hypothetical protein n=1 Tax=Planococcus sp. 107-1 TaxID=2908840 RepID=UPI001F3F7711|nr:hypothetical protein [Planococcus sp. 107-1]UJF25732.1 hypothetical protein L0M13_10835 [Planococcus sp. 107-1]